MESSGSVSRLAKQLEGQIPVGTPGKPKVTPLKKKQSKEDVKYAGVETANTIAKDSNKRLSDDFSSHKKGFQISPAVEVAKKETAVLISKGTFTELTEKKAELTLLLKPGGVFTNLFSKKENLNPESMQALNECIGKLDDAINSKKAAFAEEKKVAEGRLINQGVKHLIRSLLTDRKNGKTNEIETSFKEAASKTEINDIVNKVKKGEDVDFKSKNIQVKVGVLKALVQSSGAFVNIRDELFQLMGKKPVELDKVKGLINRLDPADRQIVGTFIELLVGIAEKSKDARVKDNLSIFTPTIYGEMPAKDVPLGIKSTKFMIENYQNIFVK